MIVGGCKIQLIFWPGSVPATVPLETNGPLTVASFFGRILPGSRSVLGPLVVQFEIEHHQFLPQYKEVCIGPNSYPA